ncbi:TPA: 3'-5' exoribonuclease, partial [Escherichia coli]|nr:3'-5' exoribonuclease [Escherichia coli]
MTNQIIYDRKRSDVMIDLETMGTNTCAPIVSIGAVFFSPESEELGPTFYVP